MKAEENKALSSTSVEAVQEYMNLLHKTLTTSEMKQFANLLRAYRMQNDFAVFSRKLLALYGQDRKFLLPGALLVPCAALGSTRGHACSRVDKPTAQDPRSCV